MIKGVYQSGKYVTVANGSPALPVVYNYNASPQSSGAAGFAGQVRYSATYQALEIFDGSTWQTWHSNVATVGLTLDAEQVMDWAREKMAQEQRWAEKAKDNPTLADALENLRRAHEQVTIIEKLTQ